MKLVTFRPPDRGRDKSGPYAGVVHDQGVITLGRDQSSPYATLLELLRDPEALHHPPDARLTKAQEALGRAGKVYRVDVPLAPLPDQQGMILPVKAETGKEYALHEVVLLAPIPEPTSVRDFYAFEQHVKTARANRGLDMIPEWYEFPVFYFTNNSEIFGHDEPVPYPTGSQTLDFELEIACVIGREGKDIPVEEAAEYIAGYTIMNDWSARDFQMRDMKLNLGPGKGKDFATSLGPWLVTPDELASRRSGSGASERYDMTMVARVNGKEISRGNFNQIHYSFPQMIAWASHNARLRVGDVLGSGTVGTGCILELGTQVHPWFQPGDVIELEIDGIGVLRNRIV